MYSEILLIGAGVTGCALARVLSRYDVQLTVIDRGADVAEGASKANSGIVHAGFDAHPGTMKAKLNVEGATMYPALCQELGVPYGQPGALVIGFTEDDRKTIENLVQQGIDNGVPGVRLIERDEVLCMEPNTNPEVLCALYAPTSGLTSPYEMTFALADHAALNGAKFCLNECVSKVERQDDGLWHVTTQKGEYTAKVLVNCAGANTKKDRVTELALEDLRYMFELNCVSAVGMIQQLYPLMARQRSGLIVNILSSCCLFSNPMTGSYSASKDAMEGISKILTKEAKADHIGVCSIYPGGVDTGFRATARPDYLRPETVAKMIKACIENEDGCVHDLVIRPFVEENMA